MSDILVSARRFVVSDILVSTRCFAVSAILVSTRRFVVPGKYSIRYIRPCYRTAALNHAIQNYAGYSGA
ncbi:MAG: hypothetical protein LBI40_00780 [Treponema sp.]|nr:hypothetical protein [Treponema sp.]